MLWLGKKMKLVTIVLLVTFTSLSLRLDLWAEEIQDSGQQLTSSSETQANTQQDTVNYAKSLQDKLVSIQKLLEEIETDLNTNKDITAKLNQLKKDKAELQNLGNQVGIELNKTRSDLLSKKLPDEIIKRHDDFVGKFEANLDTTLDNLTQIEKVSKEELKEKVQTAKEFLNKNMPKHRGIPTTPTLPHGFKKLKEAPKEETGSQPLSFLFRSFFISDAYAEEDYLEETVEVQFTQEIRDTAIMLHNQPKEIYEYVRNNFEYEPYYGSLKGAVGTLHDQAGNDFDQASLLIALLRASNIPAKYVYGQIEVPIDRAKSWIGIDDSWRVADLLVTYGIPATTIVKGGQPSAIMIEHCWVEAFVDYFPSGGAIHKEGDTWIPLDPSFKLTTFYEPEDISEQVLFDSQSYLSHQQNGDALDFYMDQLETYIQMNMPDKILSQLGRIKTNIPEELEVLPVSLPYKKITTPTRYTEIPDNLRYKISVTIPGDSVLIEDIVYQASLPVIGGKRLTLSYTGDRSPYNNPAYTVVLQPEIKLDGVTQVIGGSIGAGLEQQVVIDLIIPNQGTERIQNDIITGEFHTLICTWPSSNGEDMMDMSRRLNQNITDLGEAFLGSDGFLKEDLVGDFLYLRGKSWFTQVGLAKELASAFMHLPMFEDIGYASVSVEVDVDYLFGMPYKISLSGLMIDAYRNISAVIPKTDEEWKTKEYMTLTGYASSALEHFIWEQKYEPGAISAVKAIQIANESGIPVYDIDSTNVSLIDTLTISEEAKQDMRNAINAGNVVKTPASNITHVGWTGVGYIVQDPATGEGRYEISEGSGGFYTFVNSTGDPTQAALVVFGLANRQPVEDPQYITQRYYPHAWKVAKSIQNLGYFVVFGSPYSLEWMQWWMQQLPWRIFYFYGHGTAEIGEPIRLVDPIHKGLAIIARQSPEVLIRENYFTPGLEFPTLKLLVQHDVVLSPYEDGEHYKIVFMNACANAYRPNFCDAFHIDRTNNQASMSEAYIGSTTPIHPGPAAKNGERFWQYFLDHPSATVYEAYKEELWNTGYALPYVNTGDVWADVIEWLKEASGPQDYDNPPYYNFRP